MRRMSGGGWDRPREALRTPEEYEAEITRTFDEYKPGWRVVVIDGRTDRVQRLVDGEWIDHFDTGKAMREYEERYRWRI